MVPGVPARVPGGSQPGFQWVQPGFQGGPNQGSSGSSQGSRGSRSSRGSRFPGIFVDKEPSNMRNGGKEHRTMVRVDIRENF
jgi:hypothetical protein